MVAMAVLIWLFCVKETATYYFDTHKCEYAKEKQRLSVSLFLALGPRLMDNVPITIAKSPCNSTIDESTLR